MTGIQDLPFDVLLYIMSRIHDRRALYDYIRVSKVFYEAGMPSLYRSISLVVLRDYGSGFNFHPLDTLDKHTYLRPYVEDVEICFDLNEYIKHQSLSSRSSQPSPQWSKSLSHLRNITLLTIWHPENRYYPIRPEFSDTLISAVLEFEKLEEVRLLARIDATDIGRYSKLKTVRRMKFGLLTSGAPTFNILGEWIKASRCEGLSVMEAYAVEPRTMKLISPFLDKLSTLHIGPSHALSNRDLLSLSSCTPQLRFFDIFYDNFLAVPLDPGHTVVLNHLEVLVVRYSGVWSKPSCQDLFRFLRGLLATSSNLKSFNLIADDGKEIHHPQTGLVDLLCNSELGGTLEILNLPAVVFRKEQLAKLFGRMTQLRVMSLFLIDVRVLEFYQHLNLRHDHNLKLTALYLRSNRTACPYFSVVQQVKKMMNALRGRGNEGYFRRLIQEKQTWQALWSEGSATDRAEDGADLLQYEYPEMYGRFF
ncbi:hypothetical protein E1B28_002227 [Marasmius oreades]|uniref:F-box domain-containing protein n=1 Tax=Marasmius oreades TaxID=181124 RepID=A0A9P7RMF4_9AGAR|nr:uncharacterized protein E1B28_002227 [Marasmius oreades]KAG7086259.1 hypothetical protein E1B28_002227 [Marasmius oreades]